MLHQPEYDRRWIALKMDLNGDGTGLKNAEEIKSE